MSTPAAQAFSGSCAVSYWNAALRDVSPASVSSAYLASDDRATLRARLREIADQCSREDWDGHGASAVSEEAFAAAWRFINALPNGFKMPEVSAEPDGLITFEWRRGPRRTLLVSVHPNYLMNYAALIGAQRVYGDSPVFDEVPSAFNALMEQVYAR